MSLHVARLSTPGAQGTQSCVAPHPVLQGLQSLGRDVGSVPRAAVGTDTTWADW